MSRPNRTRPLAALFLTLTLALPAARPPAAAAGDEATWRYPSASKIERIVVTPLGNVVVSSSEGIAALDPATGKPLWSRPDLKGILTIADAPFALGIAKADAEVVDLESGKTRWRFADSGSAPMSASWEFPDIGLIVLVDLGTRVPRLFGVDIASGQVRWTQEAFVDAAVAKACGKSFYLAAHPPPYRDSDSSLVIYPNCGGPVRVHLGTGRVLWAAQGWGERKQPKNAYLPQLARDGDLLFVPYDRGLLALDVRDGHVAWEHPGKLAANPWLLETCAEGVLIGAGTSAQLVDKSNGHDRWMIKLKPAPTGGHLVRDGHVYFTTPHHLVAVALSDGSLRPLGKWDFKGDEVPTAVQTLEDGFLVGASQNLWGLDATGAERFHCYYKAPGASFLAKFLSTVAVVGLNAASISASGGQGGTFITSNPVLGTRFKASVAAADNVYILTGDPDAAGREGFSLVRVDKRTGRETGRVWMDDRSPLFSLDAISGTVYFVRDDREVMALRY